MNTDPNEIDENPLDDCIYYGVRKLFFRVVRIVTAVLLSVLALYLTIK